MGSENTAAPYACRLRARLHSARATPCRISGRASTGVTTGGAASALRQPAFSKEIQGWGSCRTAQVSQQIAPATRSGLGHRSAHHPRIHHRLSALHCGESRHQGLLLQSRPVGGSGQAGHLAPSFETAHCGGARTCGHSPSQIHWAASRQRPLQLHPASPSAPPAHRLPHANRYRPTRTRPHRQPPNPLPSPPPQIPAASRAPAGSARRPVMQDPPCRWPPHCLNPESPSEKRSRHSLCPAATLHLPACHPETPTKPGIPGPTDPRATRLLRLGFSTRGLGALGALTTLWARDACWFHYHSCPGGPLIALRTCIEARSSVCFCSRRICWRRGHAGAFPPLCAGWPGAVRRPATCGWRLVPGWRGHSPHLFVGPRRGPVRSMNW